ncbi:MAG: 50S ribosome-binding GTPase [Candidatus Poseidoniales archaeon]|nr:50S ribosome-binding GTPase [Candidatus Poseidoniales archaeon]
MVSVVWRNIPTVLTVEELLDKAFSKAKKAGDAVVDKDRTFRTRKQMTRMVGSAGDSLSSTLLMWVRRWPSLDKMSRFDVAMVEAAVGCDYYRQSLGACQWAAQKCVEISQQNAKKLRRMVNLPPMHESRREAYGRICSIMGRIEKNLDFLRDARDTLRTLPMIDSTEPCLVVAGAPNVGKSALIASMSSGKPEIAAYPFTTRKLHVGHFVDRRIKYQLVDTPGLLDRPMEERNQIEMQAIAALEHVGDLCLFLMDPSETGGTSLEVQTNLLNEVASLLPQTPLVVIDGKGDLIEDIDAEEWAEVCKMEAALNEDPEGPIPEIRNPATGHLVISATEPAGIERLRYEIIERIGEMRETDPLSLPENWHIRDDSV